MASLNKVHLIGHLGADPATRYLPSGDAVTNFDIATTEKWKKDGEQQEETTWHKIVCFGKLAEIATEFLRKGGSVYVEGRIRVEKWRDRGGTDRYTTKIVAQSLQFLSRPRDESGRSDGDAYASASGRSSANARGAAKGGAEEGTERSGAKGRGSFDDLESDIPF